MKQNKMRIKDTEDEKKAKFKRKLIPFCSERRVEARGRSKVRMHKRKHAA